MNQLIKWGFIDTTDVSMLNEMIRQVSTDSYLHILYWLLTKFDKVQLRTWRSEYDRCIVDVFMNRFSVDEFVGLVIDYLIEECGFNPNEKFKVFDYSTDELCEGQFCSLLDICIERHMSSTIIHRLLFKYGCKPVLRIDHTQDFRYSLRSFSSSFRFDEGLESYIENRIKNITTIFNMSTIQQRWHLYSKRHYYMNRLHKLVEVFHRSRKHLCLTVQQNILKDLVFLLQDF